MASRPLVCMLLYNVHVSHAPDPNTANSMADWSCVQLACVLLLPLLACMHLVS